MGVKIAVVGGGSTYTPELVEGFAGAADRLPIDELVLLDIDAERLEIVGGLAQRMLDRLDWPGRLTSPATATPPSTAPTSCSSSCASAARPPASSTRRCRRRSASSARRRPAPAASPRRCGPCPSSWSSPS